MKNDTGPLLKLIQLCCRHRFRKIEFYGHNSRRSFYRCTCIKCGKQVYGAKNELKRLVRRTNR